MKFIKKTTAWCHRLPRAVLAAALSMPLFTHAAYCPPISAVPLTDENMLLQSSFEELPSEPTIDTDSCQTIITDDIRKPTTLTDKGSGCDYEFKGSIYVRSQLTVEPGVTIVVDRSSFIRIEEGGSFILEGTANNRIRLIGARSEKGYWQGIRIGNRSTRLVMNHVDIRDAGVECTASFCPDGAVVLSSDAKASITNSTISGSPVHGLSVGGGVDITMSKNRFCDNGWAGILVSPEEFDSLDTESDYSFDLSPNGIPYVLIGLGFDLKCWHWPKLSEPYTFTNLKFTSGECTFEPGATFILPEDAKMEFRGSSSLRMHGTESRQIVFKAPVSTPGAWESIIIQDNSGPNSIKHVTVEDAIDGIAVWGAEAILEHVTIKNSSRWPIWCPDLPSEKNIVYAANVSFIDNGFNEPHPACTMLDLP